MDPASIVKKVVEETALDGIYGMEVHRLWLSLDSWLPQPSDEGLKSAIWQWIENNEEINIETSDEDPKKQKLFASTNAQWISLTGAPPLDNPIGDKVFEVLNLIAHCRQEGITTVQISKRTGQDSRLLFGRIQTLINHGLVRRYPVIEDGAATNKMFFHLFISQRENSGPESDQQSSQSIDKNTLYRSITDYSQSGPQHMRLTRAITESASQRWPGTKKSRIRRIVSYAINELEQHKCVRRVAVADPDRPDVHYQCVEYRKDPPDNSVATSISGVVPTDGLITAVDDDEDEEEEQDEGDNADSDIMKTEFDRVLSENGSRASTEPVANGTEESNSTHRANLVFPLINQIYDRVREAGKDGISTMELNHSLTGTTYRRTSAKYSEMMTPSNTKGRTKPEELEYLDLVKGVDFNRRIKYYRYFTKMAYSDTPAASKAHWGEFPHRDDSKITPKSLLEIEQEQFNPPRLNCMIVRTKDGVLKPIFRGDMSLSPGMEIVLKSDPGPANSTNSAQPAKKRGRPRKTPLPENTPPPPPPSAPKSQEESQQEIFKREITKHIVPMSERKWTGGEPVSQQHAQPSVYLSLPTGSQQITKENSNKTSTGEQAESNESEPVTQETDVSSSKTGKPKDKAVSIPEKGIKTEDMMDVDTAPSESSSALKVTSIAFQQRLDRFCSILNAHKGVVQGGTWLITKFSENWQANVTIDRRTMSRVVNKLISMDKLRQVSFNVPTPTGKVSLKTIYYDPSKVTDPDTDSRVQEVKAYVISRNSRDSNSMAARVASALARARANVPIKQVTQEQLEVLRPRPAALPGRISTAGGSGGRVSTKSKMKYGPSAAEVSGVDKNGELKSRPKRAKRDLAIENRRQKTSRHTLTDEEKKQQQLQDSQDSLNQIRGLRGDRDAMDTSEPGMQSRAVAPQYRTRSKKSAWPLDLDVLARRVVIYKSLVPRRGSSIDWKVVVHGLPGSSATEAQRLWPEIRKHMSETSSNNGKAVASADIVMSRIDKFESMFVEAFHRDEVKIPDMDSMRKTVPDLAEWWLNAEIRENEQQLAKEAAAHANPSIRIEQVTQSSKSLKLKPRSSAAKNPDPFAPLQSAGSVVNAEKSLLDTPFSIPDTILHPKSSQFTSAESRVRAVIAADSGPTFNAALASEELSGLSNDDVMAAKTGLEQKRVIQWAESDTTKTPSGRPYILHDLVLAASSVPKSNPEIFLQAAQSIEDALTKPKFSLRALPTIQDDQIVMSLEILTMDESTARIKREGEKFGMISEDYKSRDIDKQAFECDLEVQFNNPNPLTQFGSVKQPVSPDASRPYIWQTKSLSSQQIWSKVLAKIFSIIVFRPQIPLINVAIAVGAALDFEETEAAVNAMVDADVLVNNADGLAVSSEWYLNLKCQ